MDRSGTNRGSARGWGLCICSHADAVHTCQGGCAALEGAVQRVLCLLPVPGAGRGGQRSLQLAPRQRSLLPAPTAQHAARALHLCCSSLYSSGLVRLFFCEMVHLCAPLQICWLPARSV